MRGLCRRPISLSLSLPERIRERSLPLSTPPSLPPRQPTPTTVVSRVGECCNGENRRAFGVNVTACRKVERWTTKGAYLRGASTPAARCIDASVNAPAFLPIVARVRARATARARLERAPADPRGRKSRVERRREEAKGETRERVEAHPQECASSGDTRRSVSLRRGSPCVVVVVAPEYVEDDGRVLLISNLT